MSTLEILGLVALVGLVAAAAAALAVGRRARAKLEKLHTRFLWLEESNIQLSWHLGDLAARDQRRRGAASLAPSAADEDALVAGQWTRLAGGAGDRAWDPMCFKRARGLASFRDHLYVGLESQRKGNAEVWRRDGRGDWVAVGGDGRNASWVTADEVVRLVPYGDRLLAGVAGSNLEAEVWSWDGEAWRRVGSAEQGSWPNNRFQVAQSMAVMGGALYVGMWCREDTTEKHPCLYRYDGDGWTQVGDPPWDSTGPEEGVYELAVHGDALYAGLGGEAGAGGVWRVDDNDAWRQMAGDGVNGSWDNPSADYVIALTDFKSCLVASTERVPTAHGEFSTIWALEDDGWHPVGIRAVPRQWGEMHSFNALHAYRGNLLLGAGGTPGGKASLWRLDFRGTWQLLAGYGKNGSWGARDGGKPIARRAAREYVYRMIEHEGDLIVGFGASAGCAQVWRYRPPVAQEAA